MDYNKVVELLKEKNITFGSAESLTGGLFAAIVTNFPGISKVFKGTVVSYWTEVKHNVLNVSNETINNYGVVSNETAKEMALGLKNVLNVDLAISFTGNAGPSTMENKPVGRVYIGIAYKDVIESHEFDFKGNREEIRRQCIDEAFDLIYKNINR